MYDVKTLKATPGLARRLIAFSEINSMSFDDELVNLALQGLISRDQLKNFPFDLDDDQVSALQFTDDWEGRALLMGDRSRLRITALASAWCQTGKLLIIASPTTYDEWSNLVSKVWPTSSISVFGNQRYVTPETIKRFPSNAKFTTEPDFGADVFITSYGGVIWNNFLGKAEFEQTILEEFETFNTLNYKWESAVKGMAKELPRPIYIQDFSLLPTNPQMDLNASLQMPSSKATLHVSTLLRDYVRAGVPHRMETFVGDLRPIAEYLRIRGYKNFDFLKLYSLFGVSTHLMDHSDPLFFYDDSIRALKDMKPSKREGNGLNRLVTKEREMLQASGRTLQDTVRLTLEGNDVVVTLVGALMNTQWATLKAAHIKSFLPNLAGHLSRTLILANHKDLVAGLRVQLGFQAESMRDAYYTETAKKRFLGAGAPGDLPLLSLIVDHKELLDPDLLQRADFLILGDVPLSHDDFTDLKDLAKHYGIKIVIPMVLDTWEEEIFRQLV